MRYARPTVFVIVLLSGVLTARGDEWESPRTMKVASLCQRFTALVIPGDPTRDGKPANVHVYEGDPSVTGKWQTIWAMKLDNPSCPVTVFLSDDAKYLVTMDDWESLGIGRNTLVIYARDGAGGRRLARYSLEDLLTKQELEEVPRTISSKWWRRHSHAFVDTDADGKSFFCIWLALGRRWIVWDLATGQFFDASAHPAQLKRWNDQARQWALDQLAGANGDTTGALRFLRFLNDPRDQELLQSVRPSTQPVGSNQKDRK